VRNFEKESQVMDMKEEIMNDVMDDAMEGEDDEAETDEIVNQVLDEIGVHLDQSVNDHCHFDMQ
jgi:charged multivesicular body protein 2A